MSKRGPYAQQAKGRPNSFNRQAGKNKHHNDQQQQNNQGQPVSAFENSPKLSLAERLNAPLSAGYVGKNRPNYRDNIRDGRGSRHNDQSSSQHQNDQYNNSRELNSNRMESNPARSSTPNRGRGRGGRGGAGGGRGRGNGENRGVRGGYQGRNDDGRGRDGVWNGSVATPPAVNDTDEEFEDNVRDLTAVMPASRMAKFSNTSLEQASYEEVRLQLDSQHIVSFTDARYS